MSNIVAFEPKRGGQGAAPSLPDAGRILFFTGVRYVREREGDTLVLEGRAASTVNVHEAGRDEPAERLLA